MDDKELAKTAKEQAEASAAFAANMAKVAERSHEIWKRFLKHNAEDDHPLHADPLNTLPAFQDLAQSMMENPKEMAERTLDLWTKQAELWRRASMQLWGLEKEKPAPVVEPAKGDKRFRHQDWSENQVFDYIKQSYLLTSQWILGAVHEVGDLSPRDRRKVDFFTRNFVEAMSPTNFAATNPEVIHATFEEKGENLVRGLDMMLEDLERGKGKLLIRQTDMDAFEVGRNMAMTEGQVIWRNEILELIQYAPATEKVLKTPLLFIPPWINKYYILDLNPEKSLVKWLVEQGHTVFLISWVNPDERQKDETWESYMFKGASAAMDKVLEETGEKQLNLAGYCIGGTLTGTMMAYLGKTGDKRVKTTTFFTAQLEFTDAGELQVLVDEETLAIVDEQMEEKGYLPAVAMANAFNMLRSTDLIWGYVINNYYLGKEPFPFDLLYWNSDSTCMPARVHHYYLETFYNNNAFAAGTLKIRGEPVTMADVKGPVYHVAAKEDHIAPAASVYRGAKMMTGADVRYVLAGSGHIAGVVNPPALGKYQHWTNDSLEAETLEDWLKGAEEHAGSWWPDWDKWLKKRTKARVPAREPGKVLGRIEPAPGSYVRVRFDQT